MAFIASPDPHTAEYLFYRNPGADMRLQADELEHDMLSRTKAFHFGSLSLAEEPIRNATYEAVRIVKNAGGLVSFDVNYRPTLWASPEAAYEQIMVILPQVNLLKVNEVELKLLTGEDEPETGSQALSNLGPEVCVMTSGAEGSYFRIGGEFEFVPAFSVKTVDATGCGDAFIAGLLSQLAQEGAWRRQMVPELMRRNLIYANAVGALTAQTQGVIPALPSFKAVEDFLSQQPEWREQYA